MTLLEAYLIMSLASCLFYIVRFWRSVPASMRLKNKESKNG